MGGTPCNHRKIYQGIWCFVEHLIVVLRSSVNSGGAGLGTQNTIKYRVFLNEMAFYRAARRFAPGGAPHFAPRCRRRAAHTVKHGQTLPSMVNKSPNMVRSSPKLAPKWSNIAQIRSQIVKRAPKNWSNDCQNMVKHGPKVAQYGKAWSDIVQKTVPHWSHTGQNWPHLV